MNFLIELLQFLKFQKKLWLAPIIILILMVGGLLVLTKGTVVAPFVYTLF